jgi:hypothetical protein
MTIKNDIKEAVDIDVTLDVVLTIAAKTNAEAYKELDDMGALNMLKLAVEQFEFSEISNKPLH